MAWSDVVARLKFWGVAVALPDGTIDPGGLMESRHWLAPRTGGGGNDLLAGGSGDDILHAGSGHDYLAG